LLNEHPDEHPTGPLKGAFEEEDDKKEEGRKQAGLPQRQIQEQNEAQTSSEQEHQPDDRINAKQQDTTEEGKKNQKPAAIFRQTDHNPTSSPDRNILGDDNGLSKKEEKLQTQDTKQAGLPQWQIQEQDEAQPAASTNGNSTCKSRSRTTAEWG
jgi:hypothetical protein